MSGYSDYYVQQVKDVCDKIGRGVNDLKYAQASDSRQTAEAFNRMALAIEGLTTEVRALREDLSPGKLDKPKLPGPAENLAR